MKEVVNDSGLNFHSALNEVKAVLRKEEQEEIEKTHFGYAEGIHKHLDNLERKTIQEIFWNIAERLVSKNQWRAFVFKHSIGVAFLCQKEYDNYKDKIMLEMLKVPFINNLVLKEKGDNNAT